MNFFYRIVFVFIAVCIPIICIFSAFNIVFRMPDLYVYEFNKNQIADEIDLGMKDEELGRFFSDFMSGEKDDFDLFTEYRDREQAVFGTVEQINMENARKLLNYALFILGGAAIIFTVSCLIFFMGKKKFELRTAYKSGILVFGIAMVLLFALFNFRQSRTFLYQLIFIKSSGADDVLPLMLTEQFAQMSLIAISVIALILLIILASIVWRLTKPRRMFW